MHQVFIGEDGKKSHNPNTVVSLPHHSFFFTVMGTEKKSAFCMQTTVRDKTRVRLFAYCAWQCLIPTDFQ